MGIWAAAWSLLLIVFVNGCAGQMPCCRYLMAPSTIYVQMSPNQFESPSQEQPTTPPTRPDQSQVYANHLQWMIMTDTPWTQENNVYYVLNTPSIPDQPIGQPGVDQPTFYFMPNWWNKMQRPIDVNNSPGFVQLQSPVLPSANPAFQIVHHSYPPPPSTNRVAIGSQEAQELASTTALNEQPDSLTPTAKDAQPLLLEIQRQLQHLSTLHSTPETTETKGANPSAQNSSAEHAAFDRASQQTALIANHAPTTLKEPASSRARSSNDKSTKDLTDEEAAVNETSSERMPTSIDQNPNEDDQDHRLHDNQRLKSADHEDEVERRRSTAKLSRKDKFGFTNPRFYDSASRFDRWPLVFSALILTVCVFP